MHCWCICLVSRVPSCDPIFVDSVMFCINYHIISKDMGVVFKFLLFDSKAVSSEHVRNKFHFCLILIE